MITKRIIPCLDVRNGQVVKGTNFVGLREIASPVELAKEYSACGADELVFYDITASSDGRDLFTDVLTETARNVFIPLTVSRKTAGSSPQKTNDVANAAVTPFASCHCRTGSRTSATQGTR